MREAVAEVNRRRRLCQDPQQFCHAGGMQQTVELLHHNYGLPCVVEVDAARCCYCGTLIKETP